MIDFDCHAHVYETVTAVAGARYVPAVTAPLATWIDHQRQHGLTGGVIVQVSFLGTDNSELCAALATLDRTRFAGVAVVAMDVGGDDLDRLVEGGVRGVRWNLVRGKDIPDVTSRDVQGLLAKLRQRGMHLEIHLEGARLAPVLPKLVDQGIKIVVDHFGLPSDPDPMRDPMVAAMRGLSEVSMLYCKFSAQYRTPFNLSGHAREIRARLDGDHIVWGSDWPHTQHEQDTSFGAVHALCDDWGIGSDSAAVTDLYGLRIAR